LSVSISNSSHGYCASQRMTARENFCFKWWKPLQHQSLWVGGVMLKQGQVLITSITPNTCLTRVSGHFILIELVLYISAKQVTFLPHN